MTRSRHTCAFALPSLIAGLLVSAAAAAGELRVDKVLVKKSSRTMYLIANNTVVRRFHIALGAHPVGDKRERGDERTPEGHYTLDFKNSDSEFYKSIHISYPGRADAELAKIDGVDPGDGISIHGQKNGYGQYAAWNQKFDWTQGCIAVSDKDMDVIWRLVPVGTPIEIDP